MKKKQNKKKGAKEKEPSGGLKRHTKHGIIAVIFFVLALFLLMSILGLTGSGGSVVYEKFYYLLGVGYILLPVLLTLLGISSFKSEAPNIGWLRVVSATLFLLAGLGMIDIPSHEHAGGLLGKLISTPLVSLFDVYASIIFLGAVVIISLFMMFDAKPDFGALFKRESLGEEEGEEDEDREEEEDEKESETPTTPKTESVYKIAKKEEE